MKTVLMLADQVIDSSPMVFVVEGSKAPLTCSGFDEEIQIRSTNVAPPVNVDILEFLKITTGKTNSWK